MAYDQHEIEEDLRRSIAAVIEVTGEQYKDLAVATGLAPTLVSRRQRGVISWRISDIGRLADHWGMPRGVLFEGPNHAVAALPQERVAELRRAKEASLTGVA